jgi:orotidine-5'-phosphate decarboxylase
LVTDTDKLESARKRIIVALDVATASEALKLARGLRGRAGLVKVGSQLFTAAGPEVVSALVARGERVFLDLKFHDIPHIVAAACANVARMGVDLVTVHTAGGPRMLRAAREALEKHARARKRPRLLGVTLLTSLSGQEVRRVGFSGGVETNVVRLARLARRSGCDGIVAAPTDVASLRQASGRNFLIVTPGIHARGGRKAPDQARVATAADAIRAGADFVVVGRAVLQARSPTRAVERLAEEISAALE